MSIKHKGTQNAEWYDLGLRKLVSGIIIDYEVTHSSIGTHNIMVKVSNINKIVVNSPVSTRTTSVAEQIKNKSLLFIKSDFVKDEYYHMISIAYLDNGRLRRKRVKDINKIPSYINQNFEIKKHHEVRRTTTIGYSNKYVGICDKEEYEKMVLAFVAETIIPMTNFI